MRRAERDVVADVLANEVDISVRTDEVRPQQGRRREAGELDESHGIGKVGIVLAHPLARLPPGAEYLCQSPVALRPRKRKRRVELLLHRTPLVLVGNDSLKAASQLESESPLLLCVHHPS